MTRIRLEQGMQAAVPLFERRFFQALRQTLSISYSTQYLLNSRTVKFCTQATDSFESIIDEQEKLDYNDQTVDVSQSTKEDTEEPKSLCGRIEKLARGVPIAFAFQSWMGDGFPIERRDIFHTINRLRKRKFNKRALEVTRIRCLIECLIEYAY